MHVFNKHKLFFPKDCHCIDMLCGRQKEAFFFNYTLCVKIVKCVEMLSTQLVCCFLKISVFTV